MFNLQGSEIVVILLLALVVLGPEKLPDAVRKFTQTYAELKKMSSGFQSELKSALDEPMREMRETAGLVRNAADPSKLMAEMENEERVLKAAATAAPAQGTTDAAPNDLDESNESNAADPGAAGPETPDPGTTTSDGGT